MLEVRPKFERNAKKYIKMIKEITRREKEELSLEGENMIINIVIKTLKTLEWYVLQKKYYVNWLITTIEEMKKERIKWRGRPIWQGFEVFKGIRDKECT